MISGDLLGDNKEIKLQINVIFLVALPLIINQHSAQTKNVLE